MAAQNLRRINKEKDFPLGDFENRLHETMSLTGMDFQKQGRGGFFFCLNFYMRVLKRSMIFSLRSASE